MPVEFKLDRETVPVSPDRDGELPMAAESGLAIGLTEREAAVEKVVTAGGCQAVE